MENDREERAFEIRVVTGQRDRHYVDHDICKVLPFLENLLSDTSCSSCCRKSPLGF